MENNYIEDLQLVNKQNYIDNMRKNGTFGGSIEVQIYSIISKLKIVSFVRKLQATKNYNADDSDETYCFISGKNNIKRIYIMLNDKEKKESHNHYVPLRSKTNKNELSKELIDEIKKV